MLKEKRFNYAIGLIFCILFLGFMSAPFIGDACCYELLELISIMHTINEYSSLVSAICSFIIVSIVAVCLLAVLAVTGFILKCSKYKQSKVECIISTIYSSTLFIVIAISASMLILSLVWLIKAELSIKYGLIVLFALIYFFPYFCATNFHTAFIIYMIVLFMNIGIIFYILHEKVFKPRCYKQSQ